MAAAGGVEVEALEGGLLLEAGAADALGQGHAGAAGDLVLAQHLQEVQVAALAAWAEASRASRVSSIPDSLSVRSAWASALRSVTVRAAVMMSLARCGSCWRWPSTMTVIFPGQNRHQSGGRSKADSVWCIRQRSAFGGLDGSVDPHALQVR
jgi:hypothetical protein